MKKINLILLLFFFLVACLPLTFANYSELVVQLNKDGSSDVVDKYYVVSDEFGLYWPQDYWFILLPSTAENIKIRDNTPRTLDFSVEEELDDHILIKVRASKDIYYTNKKKDWYFFEVTYSEQNNPVYSDGNFVFEEDYGIVYLGNDYYVDVKIVFPENSSGTLIQVNGFDEVSDVQDYELRFVSSETGGDALTSSDYDFMFTDAFGENYDSISVTAKFLAGEVSEDFEEVCDANYSHYVLCTPKKYFEQFSTVVEEGEKNHSYFVDFFGKELKEIPVKVLDLTSVGTEVKEKMRSYFNL